MLNMMYYAMLAWFQLQHDYLATVLSHYPHTLLGQLEPELRSAAELTPSSHVATN